MQKECIEHTLHCSEDISKFWNTLFSTVHSKGKRNDVILHHRKIGSNFRTLIYQPWCQIFNKNLDFLSISSLLLKCPMQGI